MTAKAKRKTRPAPGPTRQRSIVLVFGEDQHDCSAICDLAVGLRPDLKGHVETRRRPLVLIKGAKPDTARSNAKDIAKLAKQESVARNVVGVLAHQDCDALEPAHVEAAQKIEQALHDANCLGTPIAVTPAWEIETWWLLFPEAVASIVKGWRIPDGWLGRDVGLVKNTKEELTRAVRSSKVSRDYRESDSISIARAIVAQDLLSSFDGDHRTTAGKGVAKQRTRSHSFGEFRRKVLALPKPPTTSR